MNTNNITFTASPFDVHRVIIRDEPDPTCLISIGGERMRIVGVDSIHARAVNIKTAEGWRHVATQSIPVVRVERKP